MPYNPITLRFKQGVRDSIAAMLAVDGAPGGFVDTSIVVRPTPSAEGLKNPAIVVSGGRNNRKASPAGCRVRDLAAIVSIYLAPKSDGAGVVDQDTQEQVVGLIEAMFDLPPEMPEELVDLVPEAQELRVRSADSYLPAQFRYFVGGHRIAVVAEVCQLAGVA